MTKTQKIAKGVALITELLNRTIEPEQYLFKDIKIDCYDIDVINADDEEIDFEISFADRANKKEINFILRINIEKELFKINIYEDIYEEFDQYDYSISIFWRQLLFSALTS